MSTVIPPTSAPARPQHRVQALDGLRGLALLGMLAWHAQVGWVKGGFARMTIFFVLSGYLAAASWLSLRRRDTPKPFGTFWRRRVRRLLPMTLVGVGLGTAVTVWVGSDAAVRDLRGDAASVLFGVSNWRFLFNGQSYGELFERPSAFQHFWSLSLEEQCFWLLPVVLAVAAAVSRRWAWALVSGAAVALAAIPALIEHSPDAAYYGTHVRGGEFLAGVALALVLERCGGSVPARWQRPAQVAGAVSLAALVLVMLTVDRTGAWLYAGGLGLFAIPAAAVVASTRAGRGPAPAVLSLAPLTIVGRAAFSIYVLHWPLFQVLTPERTGVHGGALALLQIAVGIAVGLAAFHLLERPLLEARAGDARGPLLRWWVADRRVLPALGAGVAALLVVTVAVPRPAPAYDLRALERRLSQGHDYDLAEARQVLASQPLVQAEPAGAEAGRELRIGLFGGSTAVSLGAVGSGWSQRSALAELAPGYARLGCGIVTEGERVFGRTPEGAPKRAPADDYCLEWQVRWPAVVTDQQLDVAVVMTGVWEISDWYMGEPEALYHVGHPGFDLLLVGHLHEAVDLLQQRGASVVLVTTPLVGHGSHGESRQRRNLGDDHAARVARFNELVRDVAAAHPGVSVIDYGAYVDSFSAEQSAAWLPDGIHPTEAAGTAMWDEFLGPELDRVAAALVARSAGVTPG